jgi:predicted nucleotidyltransferase
LRLAAKVAKLLSLFPYVRGVAISGSLSKNFADESSDIDLFFIMEKNRLWIGRTILMLFRRLALPLGKESWFCMNYFVDEAGLEIVEKNFFTAIEIVTLVPMRGIRTFDEFFAANGWTKEYFPNNIVNNQFIRQSSNWIVKRAIEKIFNLRLFNQVEDRLLRITERRWKKRTGRGQLTKKGIVVSLDVSEHYAKPTAKYFQLLLLEKYRQKLCDLFGKTADHEAVL